jgi:hypothetical protein
MADELDGAITVLVAKVDEKAQELSDLKRMVNSLCRDAGKEAVYSDSEITAKASGVTSLKLDQFYGKQPTVAAREYLQMRGTAVPLDEIIDALDRGGFDYKGMGWAENARRRNLAAAMGKNSSIFHRLPNQTWGLTKNYNIRTKKTDTGSETEANGDSEAEE